MSESSRKLALDPHALISVMTDALAPLLDSLLKDPVPLAFQKDEDSAWTAPWHDGNATFGLHSKSPKYMATVCLPWINLMKTRGETPQWSKVVQLQQHFWPGGEAADCTFTFTTCLSPALCRDKTDFVSKSFELFAGTEVLWASILACFIGARRYLPSWGKESMEFQNAWTRVWRSLVLTVHCSSCPLKMSSLAVQSAEDLMASAVILQPCVISKACRLKCMLQDLGTGDSEASLTAAAKSLASVRWADKANSWGSVRVMGALQKVHKELVQPEAVFAAVRAFQAEATGEED